MPGCWNTHVEATKDGNDIRIENCAQRQSVVSSKELDAGVPSVLCKMLEYSVSNTESKNLQKTCMFWKTWILMPHEGYG